MALWFGIILVGGLVILGLVLRVMGDRPPRCKSCGRTIHTPIVSTIGLIRPQRLAGAQPQGPPALAAPVLCTNCNRWYCRACWLRMESKCPGCGSADVFSTLDRVAN
jgi:hypothetical protein